MFKKLLLTSFLLFSLISVIYPAKKENTKLFDYCYSLEKILSRNSIQIRRNASTKVKTISKDISKFGISKTRGRLINMMIDQYKTSKNSQIIKLIPNKYLNTTTKKTLIVMRTTRNAQKYPAYLLIVLKIREIFFIFTIGIYQ